MFDSAYAFSKKLNHQFRHFMICLKVANKATHNYHSCESLSDFLQLQLQPTSNELTRLVNKKVM